MRGPKRLRHMALFKKFGKEDISNLSQVKSSVARGIRCEWRCAVPYGEPCRLGWACADRAAEPPHATPCLVAATATASICESYPFFEETEVIEVLIPKKESVYVGKW